MSNYAIIENTLVTNIVVADADYAQANGWIACTDDVSIGWEYVNGQFVAASLPPLNPEEIKTQNKTTATFLLQQTDWTATVDIADPQYSNPHLLNRADFLTYRSLVRTIAVNPPTTPAVFPTLPTAIWS